MSKAIIQHIFIVGSKGIPGNYGGYETFVDKLTEYHQNNTEIQYHIACKGMDDNIFEYHNAHCFNIKVPNIGPIQAIYYDVMSIKYCLQYIKKHQILKPIIYVLACRIGLFLKYFQQEVYKYDGIIYINPDGHEWLRGKWSLPVRKYWKVSEQLMVKYSDLVICDSQNIENYINQTYTKYFPKTTFIAYGAEVRKSLILDNDSKIINWYKEKNVSKKNYYLIVGRFVPENNYEVMIKEFMKSNSKRDLVIITNVNKKFFRKLKKKTAFNIDKRIKFVGTVYDRELLLKIRENAYGYLHGHEVGGTNPSLLEALGSTELNLLLDVSFNKEVAGDAGLYWKKDNGNLAKLIHKVEHKDLEEIKKIGIRSNQRIVENYSWKKIQFQYMEIWKSNKGVDDGV